MNLGKFVDTTEPPKNADLIVSLGGDTDCRVKKTVELYKEGYVKSKKIFLTGQKLYRKGFNIQKFLLANGVVNENILNVNPEIVYGTMEEILFMKEYMLTNHYKSVIFVSHPFHARRIATLANNIANYNQVGLQFTIVGCDSPWWDRTYYYKKLIAIKYTLLEIIKLPYNLVKYSPLFIDFTNYNKKIENNTWKQVIDKLPK